MSKFPGNIEATLVLCVSVVSAGLLLFPFLGVDNAWIPGAGLLVGGLILGIAIFRRTYFVVHLALFFLLLFGWKESPFWPADLPTGLLPPFLSYLAVVLAVPPLRKTITWYRWGRRTGTPLLAALLILAFSLPALYLWTIYSDNAVEYYVYLFHPKIFYIELVIFALLFATINALTQEVIFRGVYQDALSLSFRNEWVAILLQALVFGLIHIEGIPSGLSGVIMAFSYGTVLGVLRRLSGGLLLPVAIHFVTDLFIFYLVFYKAWLLGLFDTFPFL